MLRRSITMLIHILHCVYFETYTTQNPHLFTHIFGIFSIYEGHLESKERFAIKKHLLIKGKKKNMQVLSHTFTYFST